MKNFALLVLAISIMFAPYPSRPAVVRPPNGRTWVCFQAPSGRVLKCAWLPNWLADRLPCANCAPRR